MNKKTKKIIINLAVIAALVVLAVVMLNTNGSIGDGYTPAAYSTILSLLPPVVAITLALITKEMYSSLFAGIVVGALLYAGGNAELAMNAMLYDESAGLVTNLTDISHAGILVFVTILGTLVVLMNKSGGAAAFGRWAKKRIKTRRSAAYDDTDGNTYLC